MSDPRKDDQSSAHLSSKSGERTQVEEGFFWNVLVALLLNLGISYAVDLSFRPLLLLPVLVSVLLLVIAWRFVLRRGAAWRYGVLFLGIILCGFSFHLLQAHSSLGLQKRSMLTQPIHLGDKTMNSFTPASPSATDTTLKVRLDKAPEEAWIQIRAKHVDPDYTSGPFVLTVNGVWGVYINNQEPFVDTRPNEEGKHGYRMATIELDAGTLTQDWNDVRLRVVPTRARGYDDVGVSELNLLYR